MKIKIKDNNSLDKGREFKVRRMNYDQVVVNYPGEKGIEILIKIRYTIHPMLYKKINKFVQDV